MHPYLCHICSQSRQGEAKPEALKPWVGTLSEAVQSYINLSNGCVTLSSISGKGENGVTASKRVRFNRKVDISIHFLHGGRLRRAFFGGFLFPECVARVPVSLWGSGGGGVLA